MDQPKETAFSDLTYSLSRLIPQDAIVFLLKRFPGQVVFSSSFSQEDQVITHFIFSERLPLPVFTLDTGRLFGETYSAWAATQEKYGQTIKAYYPNRDLLEPFIEKNGPNAFYASVENRKNCCFIRKVEPLKRALEGQAVWITGLRAEHSTGRSNLQTLEWDEGNQVLKYHPLLHWSSGQVNEFMQLYNIPYNILHDQGFLSIGCAPCTRAVRPGEDMRAGRWWWEEEGKKECGLHQQI
jgi:phosphoadenosine phosphosulfate reductase